MPYCLPVKIILKSKLENKLIFSKYKITKIISRNHLRTWTIFNLLTKEGDCLLFAGNKFTHRDKVRSSKVPNDSHGGTDTHMTNERKQPSIG